MPRHLFVLYGRPAERQSDEKSVHRLKNFLCSCLIRGPAERRGEEELVYKLIQLFSSTEIFSKRRKIFFVCLGEWPGPSRGSAMPARLYRLIPPRRWSAMPKGWVHHKRRGTRPPTSLRCRTPPPQKLRQTKNKKSTKNCTRRYTKRILGTHVQ